MSNFAIFKDPFNMPFTQYGQYGLFSGDMAYYRTTKQSPHASEDLRTNV